MVMTVFRLIRYILPKTFMGVSWCIHEKGPQPFNNDNFQPEITNFRDVPVSDGGF